MTRSGEVLIGRGGGSRIMSFPFPLSEVRETGPGSSTVYGFQQLINLFIEKVCGELSERRLGPGAAGLHPIVN